MSGSGIGSTTLEEARISRILRNEEYTKTTKLWKAVKKKKSPRQRAASNTQRRPRRV